MTSPTQRSLKVAVFRVPGDPVGYVRMTRGSKWTARAKKAHSYMREVQAEARRAGITLPLSATEDNPVKVVTLSVFRNRRHPDPENVHKLIVDALFYGAKGGDKYVGGEFYYPTYCSKPEVQVTVRWL